MGSAKSQSSTIRDISLGRGKDLELAYSVWSSAVARSSADCAKPSFVLRRSFASVLTLANVVMNPIIASAAYDSTIIFYNNEGGYIDMIRENEKKNRKPVNSMTLANDGTSLIAAYNGQLKLFDITRPRGSIDLMKRNIVENFNCMDYSNVSRRLVTGSDDSKVRLWDTYIRTPSYTMEITLPMDVLSVRLHPNQHTIFACDVYGYMCHIDIRNKQKTQIICNDVGFQEKMYIVAVSPDGNYLATGSSHGRIFVWSMNDFGAPVKTIKSPNGTSSHHEFNPFAADHMDIAKTTKPSVTEGWSTAYVVHQKEKFVTNIRFKDNETFVVTYCTGDIEVWSVHKNDDDKPIQELKDPRKKVLWAWDCTFTTMDNEDCALVCTGTDLRLWNMQTGDVKRTFGGQSMAVTAFAFYES
uniref:Target of rapamycin complex subunit lst8 n=1 Tax=Steinernema glaseri TaxID=37863 RepID=A0A1I7ZCY6_9BILA